MTLWKNIRSRKGTNMGITSDRNDPRLGYGTNDTPVPMNEAYLVLSEEERKKGFVRPVRRTYVHVGTPGYAWLKDGAAKGCGASTTMGIALAETYAAKPSFYGATYCVRCQMHRPVGENGEFVWEGTDERVGT